MVAVASYHRARTAGLPDTSIDDRTWHDLDMDAVFATLDRADSSVGQQSLYHRLRSSTSRATLGAFEALIARATTDEPARERCQLALAALRNPAGYNVWQLAEPGALHTRPWHVLSPALATAMLLSLVAGLWWSPAFVGTLALLPVCLVVRVLNARLVTRTIDAFRLFGPLIAAATIVRSIADADTRDVTAPLFDDVPSLNRLRVVSGWLTRDSLTMDPITGTVVELLNYLMALDSNALFFGASALKTHGQAVQRTLAAVGDIDAAIAVASYRVGTPTWTRPSFQPAGAPATIRGLTHPLLTNGVGNSVRVAPPHGVLITGSNMSGKSTFLRSLGVAAIMSQAINTCTAEAYECPVLRVRSCIGRADDLVAGRSYYLDEVRGILALVEASRALEPHLFLLDELFRGTNAVERIAAGESTLSALATADTRHVIVVATHDSELVSLLATTYAVFHFSDRVGPEGLVFDYRLASGPSTTRNAISLLELNGAPLALVKRARALAQRLERERQV